MRCIACDGSGKTSEVIAGVDWVAANLQLPAVVSMSLGADSTDELLDAAVLAVDQLGATIVTAAGNFNNGICSLSQGALACKFGLQLVCIVATLGHGSCLLAIMCM